MNLNVSLELLNKLVQLQPIYKKQAKNFKTKRFIFDKLLQEVNLPHITGVSGLRGAGKTVLLLQLLDRLPRSFYISLDTVERVDLFALAYSLKKQYNVGVLLLDEVHYLPGWQAYLKQIYDVLGVKVFFTSSVSLDILSTKADLSRRAVVLDLPVLSFREYLKLAKNITLNTLSFEDILKINYAEPELEGAFGEYLRYPLPSQLKDKTNQLIINVIEKIVTKDLVAEKSLSLSDQTILWQTLKFLSQITGGDISVTQLANNLKVSRYKMAYLLQLLQKAFLVHLVFPAGKNVLKEPKVLLNLPFRFYLAKSSPEQIMGTAKEDFFVTQFKALSDFDIYYLKTKRGQKTPDFLVRYGKEDYIIEIGGKSKGYTQFKGITIKNKIVATYPFRIVKNSVKNITIKSLPLYVFGLLY